MIKPRRLEFKNGESWTVLGKFDAEDQTHTRWVLDAGAWLVKTLHNCGDPKDSPTLRVSIDATCVLLHWEIERGWYDAATGVRA